MFSLITVIISLILVGLLATATIYYLGDTSGYSERANAARVVNENQQVSAAITLYQQDKGVLPAELTELVAEKYLTAPRSQVIYADTNYLVTDVDGAAQCKAINAQLGLKDSETGEGLLPACTDPAYSDKSYCCENP